MNYLEKRQFIIDTAVELINKLYPSDPEMDMAIINLAEQFHLSETNFAPTADGLVGFIHWATEHKQRDGAILTTIMHDLGEFARNREESWYCPRSYGYAEFIKA